MMKKETKRLIYIAYLAALIILTLLDLFHIWDLKMIFLSAATLLTIVMGMTRIPFANRFPYYNQELAVEQSKHIFMSFRMYFLIILPLIACFLIMIAK